MRVYKYGLDLVPGLQSIDVQGADESKVVHVAVVNHILWIWVEVHMGQEVGPLWFRVIPTGEHVMTMAGFATVHAGTAVDPDSKYVWHVYQAHEHGAQS